MLLVLSTLLVQALVNIARVPLGFDAPRLLSARLDLPDWRYPTPAAQSEYQDQLVARLRGTPGIENAAVVDRLPQLDGEPATEIGIAGRQASRPGIALRASSRRDLGGIWVGIRWSRTRIGTTRSRSRSRSSPRNGGRSARPTRRSMRA
jgi:hypothetical protein